MNKTSLGETLSQCRKLMSLTLRQVEDATGISNPYLSQLENDKIKKPSANVLYKLSNLYKIELDVLLRAAGIITNEPMPGDGVSINQLTRNEQQQLIEYLQFLRFKKNKRCDCP